MIKYFVDKYQDAVSFKIKRRQYVPPAVYNEKRVFEQPIPNIEPVAEIVEMGEHTSESDNGAGNDADDLSEMDESNYSPDNMADTDETDENDDEMDKGVGNGTDELPEINEEVVVPVIAEVFGAMPDDLPLAGTSADNNQFNLNGSNVTVDDIKIEPNVLIMTDAEQNHFEEYLTEIEGEFDVDEESHVSDQE